MARRRKEPVARMDGLLDWLDIFGPEPEKGKKPPPGLPAPGSRLPALRKEERGLVPLPPKETLADKLLSLFDAFGPSKKPGLPAQIEEETRLPAPAPTERVWDVLFEEASEEETPIYEMFQPSAAEAAPTSTRYHFFGPQEIAKIPYGEGRWSFPSVDQMAEHLARMIDLGRIFRELGESRSTYGYQDLLADAAYRGYPLYTPISVIDDRNFFTDFAQFYGIPWSVVEGYRTNEEFKRDILSRMGITLTEAFEALKPDFLPGFFAVELNTEDNKHWLFYVEPWIGKLPGV
jgi:hypothetical protein